MAILVDYNQVMLASLFASIGNHHNIDIDENLVRHMFLSSLLKNKKQFSAEFGEIVICADSKNVWRRDVYPYYKANRRKSRGESELDWGKLFDTMHKIRDELDENFPYKVIGIDRLEADDIIGTVVHTYGSILNTGSEKFLILSGDKDYVQLHCYGNIAQYDPVRKKWIKNSDPDKYLKEQILKGDSGDGVPNILSPDNCLAIGERQKPMTKKKLSLYIDNPAAMDEETKLRFNRNKTMIDLSCVPDEYKTEIISQYEKTKDFGRERLFNFFVKYKLKHLLTDIQDF